MSDIIKLLPDSVANQIAAGEVIQRPASVIKELMENAIDAGATSIHVILKDAGRTLIQVIDNGKGMSMTDARMSFERHATSKINKASDLFKLKTMGFRGEALASIAAIAQVELRTKREEDEIGTALFISGSEIEKQESVSCSTGSNFLVKNIFFNVPARRKFLKSNQTELSNIITEFERIALVNDSISFVLIHNDNELLNLQPANRRQRIINIFGKSLNQQLLSVEVETSLISIKGYIGRPEAARKKNALQYFFVNNRYMRHPYFHKAVMQSYEQLIPQGEQPNYFLYLSVDPENIDINIHPTKTEIKFENESYIWQIISAAVKEALGKFSAVPSIDFDMTDAPDIPIFKSEGAPPPKPQYNSSYNPFKTSANKSDLNNWQKVYNEPLKSNPFDGDIPDFSTFKEDVSFSDEFEGDPDYFHTDSVETPQSDTFMSKMSAPVSDMEEDLFPSGISSFQDDTDGEQLFVSKISLEEIETPESDGSFVSGINSQPVTPKESSATVFGEPLNCEGKHYQFKTKYILTSVKSGLMMIDQHRAHVRVLFDQYIEQIKNHQGVSQGVIFPEIINFTPSDIPVLEEILDDLKFLGFDLNNMGGNSYALNGIPVETENLDNVALIQSMIDTAKNKGRDIKSDLHEMTALSLAEAAAISYGQILNNNEMEKLIDNLFASSSPNYTPDGKTILSVFTNDELFKRFK